MAREIQITPKRLEYAQKIEMQLHDTLMKMACEQQEEITMIIQKTLLEMKANVADVLKDYNQKSKYEFLSKNYGNFKRGLFGQ